jgi:GWxTD domain-containing protein
MLGVAAFADAPWIRQLDPILSRDERARLTSLESDAERAKFAESIWQSKRINSEEYFRRLTYIDGTFGSGKSLSGFHTDRGRVYLSLGAPQKITRLVSSRVFFPIEIWQYAAKPESGINYAMQLLFYQRNGAGDYRLYSPALDTIRVLLNPQSGNRGIFGVNDVITPGDIRTKLTVSPAEEDVLEAATGVARGITGSGNEELIGYVTSPATVLSAGSRPKITSRISIVRTRPMVRTFESWDKEGIPVVDVAIDANPRQRIGVRVLENGEPVEQFSTDVQFGEPRAMEYRHRFYLLAGKYTLSVDIDGSETATPIETHARMDASDLLIGSAESVAKPVPFRFGSLQFLPAPTGQTAFVQLAHPQPLRWRLTRGPSVVWTAQSREEDFLPGGFLVREFLQPGLAAGDYTLEISGNGFERRAAVRVGDSSQPEAATVVSYNANLSQEARCNSIGRELLRRRNLRGARSYFESAAAAGVSEESHVNVARVRALQGDFDGGREVLQKVLARSPRNFDALATMGYIEAQLQDFKVAAEYYQRALDVQTSPAILQALAEVRSK